MKVGNLELQLTAISDNAVRSLQEVSNALSGISSFLTQITTKDLKKLDSFGTKMKNLSDKLTNINWTAQASGLQTFVSSLTPLQGILNTLSVDNLKSITSLGTRFETFGKKLTNINWTTVKKGFDSLTTAITPFIDKIASANSSLQSLNQILTKVSGTKLSKLNKIGEVTKRGTFFGRFNLRRIFNIAIVLRLGRAMQRIVQYGVDFTETLNLWQVAMRDNLDQADEFIKKMNKAYGISQQTLMNAQAIFKNMIGSLGNISDTVAYKLSESILQMATDFSSLYNVTFESAITKFQAALAGQVRPIRTSGYDITENTLYQLYQGLGGTKTQRQLNRTEKQLLAIYAVFQQMQRSGAVGDLSKTLNNFANQSRMLTENFKELATYTGLFFQDLLQSWGVLKFINAGVIFLTEIVKGLTNYKAPNFLENMFESVTDTNSAMDELQGKLLDFDKFRALDGGVGTGGALAIDEKLINALTSYQSILDNVNNEARELANNWLKDEGVLIDVNGELVVNESRLNQIKSTLASIAELITAIIGTKIVLKIISFFKAMNGATLSMKAFSAATNVALYGGIFLIIYALNDLIMNWDDMSASAKAAKFMIIAVGVALITFSTLSKIATKSTTLFTTALKLQKIAAVGLAAGGIGLLIANIALLTDSWDSMNNWEKTISIFGAIGAAALSAAAAIAAFHGSWTVGTAVPAIIGGLLAISAAFVGFKASTKKLQDDIPKYATGASNIDSGTMFIAGEAGKTEAVYTGSNGKTNVANISQMREAGYQGTKQALSEWWTLARRDIPRLQSVTPTGLYQVVNKEAKRQGKGFADNK